MGWRRRWIVVQSAIVVVAVLVVAGITVAHVLRDRNGPLWDPQYPSSSVGFSVDPGVPFTYAYTIFANSGDQPAHLIEVQLKESRGLRIEQGYVVDAAEAHSIPVDASTFGVYSGLELLSGADVPPGARRLVVLKLVVSRPGAFTAQGVDLTYSVRGANYELLFPDLLRVCAPVIPNKRCEDQPLPSPG
jgi:hypothetical protein